MDTRTSTIYVKGRQKIGLGEKGGSDTGVLYPAYASQVWSFFIAQVLNRCLKKGQGGYINKSKLWGADPISPPPQNGENNLRLGTAFVSVLVLLEL